jgi:phage tail-like protein
MSCTPSTGSFRLLDGIAGWEYERVDRLIGADHAGGLQLDERRPGPCVVHRAVAERCLLPAQLAADGRGSWYLATTGRLLRLSDCGTRFEPVDAASFDAVDLRAVAVEGDLLAVADHGRSRIRLLRGTQRIVGEIDLGPVGLRPSAVAITRLGQVVVAGAREVAQVEIDGTIGDRACLPTIDPVVAIGPARVCGGGDADETSLLVVTDSGGDWRRVWAADLAAHRVRPVERSELECCRGNHEVTTAEGFCITRSTDRVTRRLCFDWDGAELAQQLGVPAVPLEPTGSLLTVPLDSGVDGCRWQRVRVELSEPARPGALAVEVVSLTDRDEVPAEHDWHALVDTTDGMIQQPPGRYLRLRLTLRGDGTATPVVIRVRLDFERASSFDRLPAVYRQEPEAADFGARFMALFDAVVQGIDDSIDSAIGRLDPLDPSLDDRLLPALARWLGLDTDPSWPSEGLRHVLARAGHFAAGAGTTAGLVELVQTLFGMTLHIDELGRTRPWGALGRSTAAPSAHDRSGARLRDVYLSTRSRAAVRLGVSVLGRTPVDGAADPDRAVYRTGAHRVRVHVPSGLPHVARERIRAFVVANLPATLATDVRFARPGFVVSPGTVVGIGTSLFALPVPVLRGDFDHQVVLGQASLLARGSDSGATVTVGRRAAVGIDTTLG